MAASQVPHTLLQECSEPSAATKTEQVKCCQTLVCLLQSLTGIRTTIELRNEISVEGMVSSVDVHMNTVVVDAIFRKLNGEEIKFEHLFIHGNQIRYVEIPGNIDVVDAIRCKVDKLLQFTDAKKSFSKRRRMQNSRLERQKQERDAARAFKLGKGRGLPP